MLQLYVIKTCLDPNGGNVLKMYYGTDRVARLADVTTNDDWEDQFPSWRNWIS